MVEVFNSFLTLHTKDILLSLRKLYTVLLNHVDSLTSIVYLNLLSNIATIFFNESKPLFADK